MLQLFDYPQSSAAWRVRIALQLKGLAWRSHAIDLRAGDQLRPEFVALNPSASVPLLRDGDLVLGQSLAIIDHLDRLRAEPQLIPGDSPRRERVLEFASLILTDVHPLHNLRVLRYLELELGVDDSQRLRWMQHWLRRGLGALESLLQRVNPSAYCFGDAPTLADVCLVPQVHAALRRQVAIDAWPRLAAAFRHCTAQPGFQAASPPSGV